jgi:hypothetical protein
MDAANIVNRKDIYLVAALMSRGITLQSWSKEPESGKIVFSLSGEGIADLEREWLASVLMVNAITFKEAIQKVKSILYNP